LEKKKEGGWLEKNIKTGERVSAGQEKMQKGPLQMGGGRQGATL